MSRLPRSLRSGNVLLIRELPFSARVGVATNTKSPLAFSQRAFCSGDVLLSHGRSPYYQRGCSVSLPCSEWERVGPLRYCHQRSEPDWRFRRFAPTRISNDDVDLSKNC